MKNYIIDFDLFETAMIFAADCDIRHYLNGVHLVGNRIESTNGHVGYMAKYEKGRKLPKQVSGITVYPNIIIKPKNKLPTKTKINCITYCSLTLGDTPRIDYISLYGEVVASDIVEVVDGRFPNLAKLFADHKKQDKADEFFGINSEYLSRFQKALKREKFSTVIFHPKSGNQSILVEFNRYHIQAKEQALIMPVRLDSKYNGQ